MDNHIQSNSAGKPSFLYLVWTKQQPGELYSDPSVWYRCFQPAQALRALGHRSNVMSYEMATEEDITKHDFIIFFRPTHSPVFLGLISQCERKRKTYLASYDDLFFDIAYVKKSGFRNLHAPQEKILKDRPELYAKAFYFFENFIVSTNGLKNSILKHKPSASVYTHYNGVPPELAGWSKILNRKSHERIVGYFAGGAIHTPDLERVAPALKEILVECDAFFFCVETVDIPRTLTSTGRTISAPRMNYNKMFHAYWRCHTTIAPLEVNEFTNAKSGIKFLESAMLGNVVVATPIDDMTRVGNELLLPATTIDEWYFQLKSAMSITYDHIRHKKIAAQIELKHSTKAEARSFLSQTGISI